LTVLVARPAIWLIRGYQLVLSPLHPPSCRFYPSCSAYAVTALARFGLVRGGWLAVRRLLRCHPWNPGGVDPVPMTWAERNDWHPADFRPTGEHHPAGHPMTEERR